MRNGYESRTERARQQFEAQLAEDDTRRRWRAMVAEFGGPPPERPRVWDAVYARMAAARPPGESPAQPLSDEERRAFGPPPERPDMRSYWDSVNARMEATRPPDALGSPPKPDFAWPVPPERPAGGSAPVVTTMPPIEGLDPWAMGADDALDRPFRHGPRRRWGVTDLRPAFGMR
jgi:hypothetical protein